MRMHPDETLLIIRQEQTDRRRESAEHRLAVRDAGKRSDVLPSDVVARVFGRPALSHPQRPWQTIDAEG